MIPEGLLPSRLTQLIAQTPFRPALSVPGIHVYFVTGGESGIDRTNPFQELAAGIQLLDGS